MSQDPSDPPRSLFYFKAAKMYAINFNFGNIQIEKQKLFLYFDFNNYGFLNIQTVTML